MCVIHLHRDGLRCRSQIFPKGRECLVAVELELDAISCEERCTGEKCDRENEFGLFRCDGSAVFPDGSHATHCCSPRDEEQSNDRHDVHEREDYPVENARDVREKAEHTSVKLLRIDLRGDCSLVTHSK